MDTVPSLVKELSVRDLVPSIATGSRACRPHFATMLTDDLNGYVLIISKIPSIGRMV
jgi:hypothetical protein